jgi:hypothetical protein
MAACENHHHQRRANSERRDDPRHSANSRATNCQDEKECSDEFGDILVHKLPSYPTQLGKSKPHQQ